jgi:hypothetical protein
MNGAAPRLSAEKYIRLNPLSKNILRVLLYFDIFHHPLKADEIFQCCSEPSLSLSQVENELSFLISQDFISQDKKYFFLENKKQVVLRRMDGEDRAEKSLRTAQRFTRLIASFPFVRGVCISGSLSKGYMDHQADIDYFIITKPGRLWLSRTFLVLFKKIFLLNSRKYFCLNYFVDDENLRIPDKNFFTATELVFILPTYNYELYSQLMERNKWVRDYYPYFPKRGDTGIVSKRPSLLKKTMESLFNGSLGEKMDAMFFRITLRHWKKKFLHFDESTFDHRLRSRKNVSKHHPKGFQENILKAWEEKIDSFEYKYGTDLR